MLQVKDFISIFSLLQQQDLKDNTLCKWVSRREDTQIWVMPLLLPKMGFLYGYSVGGYRYCVGNLFWIWVHKCMSYWRQPKKRVKYFWKVKNGEMTSFYTHGWRLSSPDRAHAAYAPRRSIYKGLHGSSQQSIPQLMHYFIHSRQSQLGSLNNTLADILYLLSLAPGRFIS